MSLSKLESKKVLLDFKHTKEELLLKKEMVSEIDPLFNKAINDFLESNEAIKEQWTAIFDMPLESTSTNTDLEKHSGVVSDVSEDEASASSESTESEHEPETVEHEAEDKDPFASVYKMIYREIVKKSHPDKVSHLPEEDRLERCKIYMDATAAYEKKDIGGLIFYAHELRIPLVMGKNELSFLKSSLEKYKKESNILEQTYSWKWFYADEEARLSLVERFIKQILSE